MANRHQRTETFDRPAVPTPPAVQGFPLMRRVIGALILMEATNRYGHYKLGYIWAFVEPTVSIMAFYVIFSFIRVRDVDFLMPFLLAGFGSLFAFLSVAGQIIAAERSSRSLLGMVQVQLLDVMIARALSEAPKWMVVVVVINAIAVLLGASYWPQNGLASIMVFLMVILLGIGWGLVFGLLVTLVPILSTIQPMIGRIWFVTSGAFYSIEVMPPEVQAILWYNPLLHLIETQRAAFQGTPVPDSITLLYPAFLTLWFLAAGLVLERNIGRVRQKA